MFPRHHLAAAFLFQFAPPKAARKLLGIPTGFNRSAQGCEERATLGNRVEIFINPNGVASSARLAATLSGLENITALPRVASQARQPWAD
jgi:hypothetical protein